MARQRAQVTRRGEESVESAHFGRHDRTAAQARLYRVYDELLTRHGVVAAQVLLTFSDVSARESYLNARQTLGKLLEWGVVAVVNPRNRLPSDVERTRG